MSQTINHADQSTVDQEDELTADPEYANWCAARQAEYDAADETRDEWMDAEHKQWMTENGFDPFGAESEDEFLDRVIGTCWQTASGSQFAEEVAS